MCIRDSYRLSAGAQRAGAAVSVVGASGGAVLVEHAAAPDVPRMEADEALLQTHYADLTSKPFFPKLQDESRLDSAACAELISACIGEPLPIEVCSTSSWKMMAAVAQRMSIGRCARAAAPPPGARALPRVASTGAAPAGARSRPTRPPRRPPRRRAPP